MLGFNVFIYALNNQQYALILNQFIELKMKLLGKVVRFR